LTRKEVASSERLRHPLHNRQTAKLLDSLERLDHKVTIQISPDKPGERI
jgi:hypothetical protein